MTTEAVVDVEVVEEAPPEVTSLVPTGQASTSIVPEAGSEDLVLRLKVIEEVMQQAMKKDLDYGVIPGAKKPSLYKPGAEKLSVLFKLDIDFDNEKLWDGDHLTVVSKAIIRHAPSRARLGAGEGICSTREKKYAYRTAKLTCPDCSEETIFKSKFPPRNNPNAAPGWFCWADKGGCGNEFAADDPRVTQQERGTVPNPDLPDSWNTVIKMAKKRAMVDGVLLVTGASALFTQDLEDQAQEAEPPAGDTSSYWQNNEPAPPPQEKKQAPAPLLKLKEEMERFEFAEDAILAVRQYIKTEEGPADLDRVDELLKAFGKQDVPKVLRLVGAEAS